MSKSNVRGNVLDFLLGYKPTLENIELFGKKVEANRSIFCHFETVTLTRDRFEVVFSSANDNKKSVVAGQKVPLHWLFSEKEVLDTDPRTFLAKILRFNFAEELQVAKEQITISVTAGVFCLETLTWEHLFPLPVSNGDRVFILRGNGSEAAFGRKQNGKLVILKLVGIVGSRLLKMIEKREQPVRLFIDNGQLGPLRDNAEISLMEYIQDNLKPMDFEKRVKLFQRKGDRNG